MCWVGAHPYPPSILRHSFLFFGNFATQIVGFIDATISLSRWEWILFARMDPRFVGMFLPRGRPIGICEMISLYLKRLIWRMAPPSTGVFHVAVKIDASILFPLSIATAFQALTMRDWRRQSLMITREKEKKKEEENFVWKIGREKISHLF